MVIHALIPDLQEQCLRAHNSTSKISTFLGLNKHIYTNNQIKVKPNSELQSNIQNINPTSWKWYFKIKIESLETQHHKWVVKPIKTPRFQTGCRVFFTSWVNWKPPLSGFSRKRNRSEKWASFLGKITSVANELCELLFWDKTHVGFVGRLNPRRPK